MPETEVTSEVLGQFDDRRANLIPILQTIQARHYYLPEEALRRVACKLGMTYSEIYQVATFYRCFSLKPRGKHLVQVCTGTACHVRGGDLVYERAQTEAGVDASGNSPDGQFTVEPVRCVGCCGLAPVMRVGKDTYAHMAQGKVKGVLNKYRPRVEKSEPQVAAKSASHD